MYKRVRNKVVLIHQSDANPEVDLKIYRMLPTINYDLLNEELKDFQKLKDLKFASTDGHVGREQTKRDCVADEDTYGDDVGYQEMGRGYVEIASDDVGYEETEPSDVRYEEIRGDDVDDGDRDNISYRDLEHNNLDFDEFQRDNEYHFEM